MAAAALPIGPALTGLPTATIYDKIAKGMFPRPIKLGERSVGWLETEIITWQNRHIVAQMY